MSSHRSLNVANVDNGVKWCKNTFDISVAVRILDSSRIPLVIFTVATSVNKSYSNGNRTWFFKMEKEKKKFQIEFNRWRVQNRFVLWCVDCNIPVWSMIPIQVQLESANRARAVTVVSLWWRLHEPISNKISINYPIIILGKNRREFFSNLPPCVDLWPVWRFPVEWDTNRCSTAVNFVALSHFLRPTNGISAPFSCAMYASNQATEWKWFHNVARVHYLHHHRCHSAVDTLDSMRSHWLWPLNSIALVRFVWHLPCGLRCGHDAVF